MLIGAEGKSYNYSLWVILIFYFYTFKAHNFYLSELQNDSFKSLNYSFPNRTKDVLFLLTFPLPLL